MATKVKPSDSAQSKTILKVTQADSPVTLERNDCPILITNEGATGACVVNLPTDAKGGEQVEAMCLAAQDIDIHPGTGNRIIGDDGTNPAADFADAASANGDALGEKITLVCLGPDSTGDLEWLATLQQLNDGTGVFNEEVA